MLTLLRRRARTPQPDAVATSPASVPEPEAEDAVIVVRDLWKRYDGRDVLRGVSLTLRRGRILAVLGSNGAGKTTLLETVEGLRRIDRGTVKVLGHDMKRGSKAVQSRLGIQLQKSSAFRNLTLRDTVRLYAHLYRRPGNPMDALAAFGLEGKAETLPHQLSGGQFQRFNLCLATLNEPEILFLDEPTTGLDPYARRALWEKVRELRDGGTSIVLTTHYMDEAEQLCDEVAVLHDGRVVATDSPETLVAGLDAERTLVVELEEGDAAEAAALLQGLDCRVVDGRLYVLCREVHSTLRRVLADLEAHGFRAANLNIRSPNLEDVFIALTSTTIEQTPSPAARR